MHRRGEASASASYEVLGPLTWEQVVPMLASCGQAAEPTDFFCTAQWFETLAQYGIEDGRQATWYAVRHSTSGAFFALPLLERPRGKAALYGRAVTSLSNYYSSLYGPVGDNAACTFGACRALAAVLKQHHGVLDLQPLDVDHVFFRNFTAALRAEKWLCDSYFCFGNWYLEVAGRPFTVYESTIPSRIRNTVKRGLKKLNAAGDWELEILQEPGEAMDRAIADWTAVYAKSWKVEEPFPDFVPTLCKVAAQHGWLRLGVVRVQSVPIAAQIWLLHQGRMLIYKLAYDEAHKHFSAGSVLTTEMMRRALDTDHCAEVDYLTGDDAYKADWMSHRRERHGIVAFNPATLQGLLSAGRHFGGRAYASLKARVRPMKTHGQPAAQALRA